MLFRSFERKRNRHQPPSEELLDLQKKHEELRRQGNHEEAELVHMEIRNKVKHSLYFTITK